MFRKAVILVIIATAFQVQCARFRVDHLTAVKIAAIPLGHEGLEYPKQNGIYHEIPKTIGIIDDWLVAAEPSNGTIKIFNNNRLQVRLMSKSAAEKRGTGKKSTDDPDSKVRNITSEQLRVPGRISTGNDEDFFVVNFMPVESREKTETGGAYRILHYDLNGKLLGVIGRKGQPELPFEHILWMDTDKQGNLWVLYNHFEELHLDRYYKEKLITEFREKQCDEALFSEVNREKNYVYRCEFMYPFFSGDKILLVGRVDRAPAESSKSAGYQFQHRIFRVRDKNGNLDTIFSRLNDPEDYPYLPYDDNQILIWQTIDYQKIRMAVYSLSGDLTNNLQIQQDGRFSQWRSTWMTLSAQFYSIQVADGFFYVIRWR